MEFKDKLKKLRTEAGVSQEALAEAIHVSRSAIAKYENGNGNPSNETLKALAFYFGVETSEFKDKPMMKKSLMPSLLSSLIVLSLIIPLVVFLSYINVSLFVNEANGTLTSAPWYGLVPLTICLIVFIIPVSFIAINEIIFLKRKEINSIEIKRLNKKVFWASICSIYLFSIYFVMNLVFFLLHDNITLYFFGATSTEEFLFTIIIVLLSSLYPILHIVKVAKKSNSK